MKKTYIYRMLIGYNGEVEVDTYIHARNADRAKAYFKERYRDKKYNYYKAIKVGLSHELTDIKTISEEDVEKLKNSIASKSDKYSEINIEAPKFITKEEAGDVGL